MAVLEVVGLAKRYADSVVFSGVDLRVDRGEFVAVIGESGVGKSTLLNCIAALDRIDAGSVRIDGIDIASLDEAGQAHLRRARLGFVFQAFHVLPHLNVGHNVGLPLLLQRRPDPTRVTAVLAAVGLDGFADRLPQTLSGGQLQRVAIALALALRAEVLLADEPTSALDVTVQAEVLELLRELRDSRGMAVLFVSHDLAVIAELCDRVAIMRAGQVVEQGPTGQVIAAPRHDYTRELLAAVPRLGE